MDEEKKKYLEELKKQIDPEILSKMADYLTGGDDSGGSASSGGGGGGAGGGYASHSPADRLRSRRASQFQERVAKRKRSVIEEIPVQKEVHPVFQLQALVYSTTQIWTRIVESQFKTLGFSTIRCFYEFGALFKYVMANLKDTEDIQLIIGVAQQDIRGFLYAWEKLRGELKEKHDRDVLGGVTYFIVLESRSQNFETLVSKLGENRIIFITDDKEVNVEKVQSMAK